MSKISEILILTYTLNRKLGNLKKFSFTSISGSIRKSKTKTMTSNKKNVTLRLPPTRRYFNLKATICKTYSKPCQISKKELFAKTVNGLE